MRLRSTLAARLRVVAAAAALAVLAARAPSAAPALKHLQGIDELKRWFNAGQGHPRLILLLSPT